MSLIKQRLAGKSYLKDGIKIDYDDIANHMPPIVVHFLDGEGKVAKEVVVPFGQPIPIYAQRLMTMDENNRQLKETSAPLGEPLGLRLKPKAK